MSTDAIISHVTFTSRELALRLQQRWRFVVIDGGKVIIAGAEVAKLSKLGGTVRLSSLGAVEAVRWLAWAIQTLCPGAEVLGEDGNPEPIAEAPMSEEEVQQIGRAITAAQHSAIAREAAPEGGGHQAVALVTYLIKQELLELAGPIVAVVRAVVPLLQEVDDSVGDKLEDALLDLDEVDELFADAEQLTKIVMTNKHIFDR